jgi:Ser/Thr protein kinase RdoA (MazF antagonist)
MTGPPGRVLAQLGVLPGSLVPLKDIPLENASWLVEIAGGQRVVLRRYHAGATAEDLAYEHSVLAYLAGRGWVVPAPVSGLCEHDGLFHCLTRYVPGRAVAPESAEQQRRRGRDLARLHLALRGLGQRLGQRPCWRSQHTGYTVHTALDWSACARALTAASPRLGNWLQAAAAQAHEALAAIGAGALPLLVVHGDFAGWNVHYDRGRLAGVIDFGLTHLDSRPYELAIARTYRAPQVTQAYRAELARLGWPLSELEEAAIEPVYRAFRVDMASWPARELLRGGELNLAAIERQLARTGTTPG